MLPMLFSRSRKNHLVGSGDPYYANVASLLHFDGNFTDQKGKVWTPGSGVTIDTTTPLLGTGSAKFDGSSGSSVISSASSDFSFGLGAFTIEFFLKVAVEQTGKYFFDMGSGNRCVFQINPTSTGQIAYYDPDLGTSSFLYLNGPYITLNTRVHIAVARDTEGVIRAFYNGVLWGSANSHLNFTETTVALGRYGGSTGYEAAFEMDDLRITKGVARYTANFTPPVGPFPDA